MRFIFGTPSTHFINSIDSIIIIRVGHVGIKLVPGFRFLNFGKIGFWFLKTGLFYGKVLINGQILYKSVFGIKSVFSHRKPVLNCLVIMLTLSSDFFNLQNFLHQIDFIYQIIFLKKFKQLKEYCTMSM